MSDSKGATKAPNIKKFVEDILATIEHDREREIISRRFGLFDRKETLEQIGELLGITRERVRQLEKSIVSKLRSKTQNSKLPHIETAQQFLLDDLSANGHISRVSEVSKRLTDGNNKLEQARIAFLAELSPKLTLIEENDQLYQAIADASRYDDKSAKATIEKIIKAISAVGEPVSVEKIASDAKIADPKEAAGLASVSKQLATLNNRWGLLKWPMVNPKNIRDKIYVILKESGEHMHFNDIADTIKQSDFKRKDVTTQAIHNELIKDGRFVLIGRGIYALREWGYDKGTVADIITDVLKREGKPLHRDEIVKRVLKSRFVKETTILLNLQGKPQFKRVAKATYELSE